MKKQLVDQMILGSGHSIIYPNYANVDPENVNKINLRDFGLFLGKESLKDLTISEDGYIEPVYRLLTEVVVAKKYNPTDFSAKGVLKNSMHLLVGQTVYTDHYTAINNQVGVIKEVYWQEAYEENGVIVPAGINGVLRIDAESNPKLSRGILMNPPSIHSNSVSVTFAWEPSHKFADLWEFYDKLGTYDEKGELVRRIVTNIQSYSETSLVSHGADPFAQKILDNGRINNITHAAATYYGAMSNKEDYNEVAKRNIYFGDFKSLDTLENGLLDYEKIHNTGKTNNKGEDNSVNFNNMDKGKKEDEQKVETQLDLSSLFGEGLLTLKEGEEMDLGVVKNSILQLRKEVKTLTLKSVIADRYVDTVRNLTLENFKKVSGGEDKTDETLLSLIKTTNIEVLESLNNSYQTQLEEKFKLKCSKCGSYEVNRASSQNENEEEEEEQFRDAEISAQDIVRNMTKNKLNKR